MKKNNKNIAVYPGTFDPITNGHLDVIERASKLFDEVIVGIAHNINKNPLFSKEERKELVLKVTGKYKNVKVEVFSGLLVNFAVKKKAKVIIRGLRAISDFEYEFQMSLTNRKLAPQVTTVFLMPNEKYTYLNSSLVRELARFNADIKSFVPLAVQKKLLLKFKEK
ncbi:MAG: pantetheine-phosphate adenylyltransferase [Candidatus Kapaibacterium sp.]